MREEKKQTEKTEYAIELIETLCAVEKSPIKIVQNALFIMQFGQISRDEMLSYIEAL